MAATARKRPRQARAQATVDAILAAARQVLVEEGYERATTNRIARVAGVSIGSLYQYFPNKEALVGALMKLHLEEIFQLLSRGLIAAAPLPLPEAVRELVGVMLDAHRLEPDLHRVFAEQVPVGASVDVRNLNTTARSMIRVYLEQRSDELRDLDLDVASFLIVTSVEAITHAAILEEPAMAARAQLVDEITAMIVRYLTPLPPSAADPA